MLSRTQHHAKHWLTLAASCLVSPAATEARSSFSLSVGQVSPDLACSDQSVMISTCMSSDLLVND